MKFIKLVNMGVMEEIEGIVLEESINKEKKKDGIGFEMEVIEEWLIGGD